ncbi:unnamed protein product, partial [Scytosiphon promiscuus]
GLATGLEDSDSYLFATPNIPCLSRLTTRRLDSRAAKIKYDRFYCFHCYRFCLGRWLGRTKQRRCGFPQSSSYSALGTFSKDDMISTHDREHGQAAATADQVRDGERNHASLTAALRSKSLEIARNGFAGATAGAVSRVLTAPFDVAKIRFQLDHGATRRYRSSVWAAMRSIYGEEGLVTLWRGNLPAMFLWSAYAGVQFCAYEQLRTTDFLNSRRNTTGNMGSGSDSKYGGDVREGRRIPSSSRQELPTGGKTGGDADG